MGVGIAILASMQLNSTSIIKMEDYIRLKSKLREKKTNLLTSVRDIYDLVRSKFTQPNFDPWPTAIASNNTLVCLHLVIEGKSLCIGTYHMPCLFKAPEVMAIHSLVVNDLMFQLAAGQNFILAGDFNSKPEDVDYQILTEKCHIDRNNSKSINYKISYRFDTKHVLKRAYREKNEMEPIYTNFCDTSSSSRFCATLDYIFFVGRLTVKKVLELPDHPTAESYPDETYPSDHFMIAATF